MGRHTFRRGLRLPIRGAPIQQIERARPTRRIGVVAADYVGLRPAMQVSVGDDVRRGQTLFEDKRTSGVRHTAPAAGRIAAINRGDRRALQSVVIEVSRAEYEGRDPGAISFASFSGRHPTGLSSDSVVELLIESGLWTAIRARPFSRVADPSQRPRAIFVTAIDTNPLAPSVEVALGGADGVFGRGVAALTRLTEGPIFLCTAPGAAISIPAFDRVRHEEFAGPHPSGTVGLHMHTLDPVDRRRIAWHVGAQDVVAIGRLFETGTLDVKRIVSLAGPPVAHPRLLETRIGASIDELTDGEANDLDVRTISGSVLSGRRAAGEVHGYLGRYHQQISVLTEGRRREFMGWLEPGFNKYSTISTFVSRLIPGRQFSMTTSTNGSRRAIVPIGTYEKVVPFDMVLTPLLRSLLMGDLERAEELGCLELDEEDLALCTFVCPGKNDYGSVLRHVLESIEKEG